METAEQLLSELEDLFNNIKRTYETYKKCPKARLTRGYVTVKLQAVEDYWNQFRTSHGALLKNVKKEQRKVIPYFAQNQYYESEDIVMQAKTDMTELLFTLDPQQQSTGQEATFQTNKTNATQVKLPRISIPTFHGNYDTWPTFRDLFESLVDRNNSISNVEKLHYLKMSVSGEAELLLRHIQINDSNYALAWNTLKERYSNKRLIVTSLLKRMFNQKRLFNQNSIQLKALIDTTSECLSSLKNMEVNVENWDPLVNFLVVQKLDTTTHKEWEEHVSKETKNELPTFDLLKSFLEAKFRTLELIQPATPLREKIVRAHHVSNTVAERTCPMCNDKHALCHCKAFGKMEPEQRSTYAKTNNICYNCLVPGHGVRDCKLLTNCRLCKRRHHTLLHAKRSSDASGPAEKDKIQPKVLHSNVEEESDSQEEVNLAVMTSQTHTAHSKAVALLATALVECKSEDGHTTVLRTLIDPGSQGCFISQRAVQLIKARRYPIKGSIVGVGEVKTRINQAVHIEITSRTEPFSLKMKAYVISKHLTTQIPPQRIASQNWTHLEGLTLADPNYNQPSNIDLLLGVNEYAQIIQNDIVKGPPGSPIAQKTTLGWILFGKVHDGSVEEESMLVLHQQVEIDDMLKALWETDADTQKRLTQNEEECERIYKENYTRTEEGQYVVKLPFNTENTQSPEGNTMNIAMKRLEMLENRFERQPELKKNYRKVIEEYIELNHMQEVPKEELSKRSVYLPHHAVVRSDKETLTELTQNELWWNGPHWLHNQEISISRPRVAQTDIEMRREKVLGMNIMEDKKEDNKVLNFENYQDLTELLKVIIYMRRFLNYKRSTENTKAMTTHELDKALKACIKKAQTEDFEEDIEAIIKYKRVKRNSNLKSLNTYLDDEHILRVGGRLRHANLGKDTKNPIILSNKNQLTLLIVADAHQRTLHGGLQQMLCHLRSRFWILKAKSIVKRYIHKCLICARANAKARSQIMGNLPGMRVNVARPFLYSGVDFCGPFNVLISKGRGAKTKKAYIAIFICMCTKALHLELVGDLTSDAFIAAFRRFVARRGRCAHIYSDQGRNFVGANKELIDAWKAAQLELRDDVAQTLALDGTQWHFIPPYSPNFGGLWEAGVKSVKTHLKKILTSNLTFEELTTLLCQIESCLNSRPLSPIDDSDVSNLNPLTPAHFLIGETSTEIPTPDTTNLNINYLSRWQHTQRLLQIFWQRWQTEYLTRLQERPKWLRRQPEFNTDDIVLIKQDGLPPGKWLMGRIVAKHPGPDGATRVYSVKSGANITKRCVTKLCPLINTKDHSIDNKL